MMMLPDWDFSGDEAKRREFISWVGAELDRFAALSASRFQPSQNRDWSALLRPGLLKHPVGAPERATEGLNGLVWEYALLRFMFNRYWPGRRRRADDPAHAANIAVDRCRGPQLYALRKANRIDAEQAERTRLRGQLLDEWDRGTASPGRREAEADTAYLNSLPRSMFADNSPG